MDKMPNLKLIACRSTGFNNVDFEATKDKGITVVNVPTYGENTVAEYAFTMLLALMRKLPDVLQAENEQFTPQELTGHDLQGKVFGVIGTGHIGQKALKIAKGFSMETIAFDSFAKAELAQEYGFSYVDLDELLSKSDIISLHVPYLPSTHHIINADNLKKMKNGAILINTARGELVDTKALIEELNNGHLGGAAIDVVEGESLLNHNEEIAILRSETLPEEVLSHSVEISVLKKMPNVIISPHNAFNTVEAINRINDTTATNIINFWYDNVPNRVKPANKPKGKLVIIRHAESEWNATGKWTGLTDVHLSDKGFGDAAKLGQLLRKLDLNVDIAYCSEQIRTRETLEGILDASQQFDVNVVADKSINERDYGEYTGKNKWQIKEEVGDQAFNDIRRGWDVHIPGGESLKMVYARVVPFYKNTILPQIISGKNVLIVAHGNSIRALIKYLDSISDEGISDLEMNFGQILIYDINDDGLKKSCVIEKIDTSPPYA
ncbi:MAG: 2,3-bisphosphoglycerate-dependent phosphoglycerate mutase [Patescibacteria group bacterium]|nr:2,3-bisphosphoglycerate-dependent phosphoglycerate mutase [Patescibacteria group bacterium]